MTSTLLSSLRRLRLSRPRRTTGSEPEKGPMLAIILACYLMIVLDVSIVITALPQIHAALGSALR